MTPSSGPGGTPAANAARSRRTPVAPEPAADPAPSDTAGPAAPAVPVQARRGRKAKPAGVTIVVTGAAGVIGKAVLRRLSADAGVGRVVAMDVRRGTLEELDGVEWRVGDVRDPTLAKRLTGAGAVVHLAVDWSLDAPSDQRTSLNVRGTQTVVTAAAAAGVPRVVLVTSATVYGAFADNATPLPEDAPLRALAEGILADLLEMERVAVDARRVHPGLSITVVRPAALVGPGVDTLVTRHFAAPRLLCIKDSSPTWQFCHVDDLAAALHLAALGTVVGEVTVGSDGFLDQRRVEELSGMKRVEIPAALAYATAERLHRVGITPAPASELSYVMHPLVVSSAQLRATGWAAAYDNDANLRVVLDQVRDDHALAGRRLGRRDATVAGASAAGATVAVLGAAAFVRAARRARGR